MRGLFGIVVALGIFCIPLAAQEVGKAPASPAKPAVVPTGTAATVNGQPITELAVQRGLKRVPPAQQAEARGEIIDYLVDNALLDQYLQQLRIEVAAKDVDNRIEEIRTEIKRGGQTFENVMQELMLSEQELRSQLAAELRWEKFIEAQANEKVLRDIFGKSAEMFDGSMVRARHILLSPPAGDARAAEQAKAQLLQFKKQIEETAAKEVAKLPPTTDSAAREKIHNRALEDAFAELARKSSACPSKENGGDLAWFRRVGNMVEPFAKAAFALKPYQMSDVVASKFGYHLILVTERRPGKEVKFEEVKDVVKDVFCDRLREDMLVQLRARAQIAITPQPKR
ncbi:MAG TPA: peptidylprolyl isomerase [Gemmataceae bacterium]|nr:peptidylprolyl isomerase [Gemmataceae bacterium]